MIIPFNGVNSLREVNIVAKNTNKAAKRKPMTRPKSRQGKMFTINENIGSFSERYDLPSFTSEKEHNFCV